MTWAGDPRTTITVWVVDPADGDRYYAAGVIARGLEALRDAVVKAGFTSFDAPTGYVCEYRLIDGEWVAGARFAVDAR